MWRANVFTIFPEAFPGPLGVSVIGKALQKGLWNLSIIDLKKFPVKNDRIDSPPCGGGVGMVLSPLAFQKAFETLPEFERNKRKIYFSPRGRQFLQRDLEEISKSDGITMLCGRYEGVDQRILDHYHMEEVSIGDFVLLGGESAAITILEGCVRLLPGVVGNHESVTDDSFQNDLLEHDQYTLPQKFFDLPVPDVLLQGNHSAINKFREDQAKDITRRLRPDLWCEYVENKLKR